MSDLSTAEARSSGRPAQLSKDHHRGTASRPAIASAVNCPSPPQTQTSRLVLANHVSGLCEPVLVAVSEHRAENPFWGRETGPLIPFERGSLWPSRDRQFAPNLRMSLKCAMFSVQRAKRQFRESGWWWSQSGANRSPPRNSLLTGKITGNFKKTAWIR
jgi:hypothetical protein